MPRPENRRQIPEYLEGRIFKPQGLPAVHLESVSLTLDGLEALRLVDLEGCYQEAAAERMGVSRATLARVLQRARAAVTDALVSGKLLRIEGGAFERTQESSWPCPVHGPGRRRGRGCRCGSGRGRGRHRGQGRESRLQEPETEER
jgi:predicted DNA-binding protein (UPF0251 family)